MATAPATSRIAFLGNYVPRQCGIATFTTDLCESIATEFPEGETLAAAINDRPGGYDYPERVRFEIEEKEKASYRRAADFFHANEIEVVSLQHEFGIFGGNAGSHLLTFLRALRMPVVATLHTVLAEPTREQRAIMEELDGLTNRFVVMAEHGRTLLEGVYGIGSGKIDVIPHGVIDVPFIDPHFYKDHFGAAGRTVLMTFGLLSPNKGIEHAIAALPAIVKEHPEVAYHIVGATHPHLIAHEGEAYRHRLERQVSELGLEDHVVFHNRFVSKEELNRLIGGADIYITPYLNEAQITSGTLAYAFGAGKAVISTPYWHARELLAEGRGILVPFRDAGAIAEAVNRTLSDSAMMTSMRKRAWKAGRRMIWSEVARRYMESFDKARWNATAPVLSVTPTIASTPSADATPIARKPFDLPRLNLAHLSRLTDNTGLFQHAICHVPRYSEGYCVDDNARALILTTQLEEERPGAEERELLSRLGDVYVSFLWDSFNPEYGRFRNFMSHSRQWLEETGSEDSHARALWAAGTVLGRSRNEGYQEICARLFREGLPVVAEFRSPRAWAFVLLAIHEYLRRYSGDRYVGHLRRELTDRLVALYRAETAEGKWGWFEPRVTYDNARLCHALILSGHWTPRCDALEVGLDSLQWLLQAQTTRRGHFAPIGCRGFWERGGRKARFDQQPLEAHAMVTACMEAYGVTGKRFWLSAAQRCFEWYLGRNDLGIPLYDANTGGCFDALQRDRVNRNQGAESTLAFALSLVEIRRALAHEAETTRAA